ncbi:class C beta-lactamase [Undibacter mobilis]|uniref:Beta-lactamase n=1 Tax=Undibacter mobilis TaxID=2292256 RepID=A0A371BD68_9BRAD|nr:beta-lactamase [Undibacter mobilis]
MTAVLAVVTSTLTPAALAAAEAPEKLAATVERTIRPLLAQHDVPGIAVGVTVGGQQYFFTYGVASKELQTPVTKDTLFEIGSISKTFAATLAAYGVVTGKLSLDDHPGQHMPALKGTAVDKATMLHLGTYTAGGLPLLFPGAIKSEADATAFLQKWKSSAAPGTQRRYSNPSLGLFGHVAALAMKGDYTDLVEREILPKLGLAHSYIRVPQAAMADYAWGYDRTNKPVRAGTAPFAAEAYGIKASAADMIRYIEANIRPDNLDPLIRRAIEGTHVGYFKVGDMVQGLGWEQYPYPVPLERLLAGNSDKMIFEPNAATALKPPRAPSGPTLFNKTGSTRGFGAYAAFVPEKQIGVVILSNRNMPIAARIAAAHAVLEAIADGK